MFALPRPRSSWLRHLLPVAVLAVCAPFLIDHLSDFTAHDLSLAVSQVSPAHWTLAAAATVGSFWAIGRYDVVFHEWLGTGAATGKAARAGAAAVAVAQVVGFGLISGTLTRWRLMPDIGIVGAARVTAYVAVSFLAALSVLLTLVSMGVGLPDAAPVWLPTVGPGVACAAVGISIWQPRVLRLKFPPASLYFPIMAYALIDTLLASVVFYSFLPTNAALGIHEVYAAFLVAFAAGLLSGTPGGFGPFEVVILGLLPVVSSPALIGAILAYRLVYFVIPAGIGAIYLAVAGQHIGSQPVAHERPRDEQQPPQTQT